MSRRVCAQPGCTMASIWTDMDTGLVYCGPHAVLEIDEPDDSKEKRRDFAADYARDAAREARTR